MSNWPFDTSRVWKKNQKNKELKIWAENYQIKTSHHIDDQY
jgi:hypothetical protein